LADLPFPGRIRQELVAAGQASPRHILPKSGWVSYHAAWASRRPQPSQKRGYPGGLALGSLRTLP
jgi:hypothetical protein